MSKTLQGHRIRLTSVIPDYASFSPNKFAGTHGLQTWPWRMDSENITISLPFVNARCSNCRSTGTFFRALNLQCLLNAQASYITMTWRALNVDKLYMLFPAQSPTDIRDFTLIN